MKIKSIFDGCRMFKSDYHATCFSPSEMVTITIQEIRKTITQMRAKKSSHITDEKHTGTSTEYHDIKRKHEMRFKFF